MFDSIKSIYDYIEDTYADLEDIIIDYSGEIYELSVDYVERTTSEISDFLNNFFDEEHVNTVNDPIMLQLNKLKKIFLEEEEKTEEEWDKILIFSATTLGLLNEKITTHLCKYYDIDIQNKSTQAAKINALKNNLSKTYINDLFFINTFRNSIVHYNDYGHDLSNLDEISKNKLLSEAKTAIAKFEYIYQKIKKTKMKRS